MLNPFSYQYAERGTRAVLQRKPHIIVTAAGNSNCPSHILLVCHVMPIRLTQLGPTCCGRGPSGGAGTMARPDFPRTLAEFQGRFATEDHCRRYLVACRWPDGYRCPRCAHAEAYELGARELFQCRSC